MEKWILYRKYRKKLAKSKSRSHSASQGMTAAIILIAFIITAAGIAFVILTLGAEMQLELGNIGEDGKDAASSALQIEGGIVTGYGASNTIDAYAFNLKLVLSSGDVDLSSTALTVFIMVNNGEETKLSSGGVSTNLTDAAASGNSGKYGINWVRGSGNTLSNNEMARMLIGFENTGAAAGQEVMITLYTSAATLKIELTMPLQIDNGVNIIN